MLGLFVATTGASADSSDSVQVANPYTQYDADGVPLIVALPPSKQPSQAELDAIHKQQEKVALDKNWLLRGYEKQLQIHAAANQDTNLYYQLSSNKDLANLARLPVLDPNSDDGTTLYRTGTAPSGHGSVGLRAEASSAATSGFPSHGNLFKPLITPLSAPDAAGLHNFYASLPVAMTSPRSGGLPQTPPAPEADQSLDFSDIETPGMVAAKKDPLMDTSSSDLTLEILPGESIEQAKAHQENNTKLELALPLNANLLHKAQAAALSAPGPLNASQTATPAPVKTLPITDENAPLPASKALQINPIRAPIANPYDIFNR